MSQNEDLLQVLERFKIGLKIRATGGFMDENSYKNDRNILINSTVKEYLPKFVFTYRTTDEFWQYIKNAFAHYAQRKQYLDSEFENAFYVAEFGGKVNALQKEVEKVKAKLDTEYIDKQIELMFNNIDSHPYDSIGKAKELIETCCIEILTALGEDISKYKEDMTKLATHTLEALNLRASKVDDAKKGANEIKKILGGLNQIAVGIAELRNSYGSGHGKDKNFSGLTPRHARLAVGSAANLVNFLWETYELQKEKK